MDHTFLGEGIQDDVPILVLSLVNERKMGNDAIRAPK